MPKLDSTPGETRWAGPSEVGGSSDEVYLRVGFSEAELQVLRAAGDI